MSSSTTVPLCIKFLKCLKLGYVLLFLLVSEKHRLPCYSLFKRSSSKMLKELVWYVNNRSKHNPFTLCNQFVALVEGSNIPRKYPNCRFSVEPLLPTHLTNTLTLTLFKLRYANLIIKISYYLSVKTITKADILEIYIEIDSTASYILTFYLILY